jgi:circadian clock protein KaiC
VSTPKSFREFVIALTSTIKHLEITGLFTNTTSMLTGGESITETHISTITDTILLLRYVELHGEMRRGLTVLKMRGTFHDKGIREYMIDGNGLHVLAPFKGVHGILSGTPTYTYVDERARLGEMFSPATAG